MVTRNGLDSLFQKSNRKGEAPAEPRSTRDILGTRGSAGASPSRFPHAVSARESGADIAVSPALCQRLESVTGIASQSKPATHREQRAPPTRFWCPAETARTGASSDDELCPVHSDRVPAAGSRSRNFLERPARVTRKPCACESVATCGLCSGSALQST